MVLKQRFYGSLWYWLRQNSSFSSVNNTTYFFKLFLDSVICFINFAPISSSSFLSDSILTSTSSWMKSNFDSISLAKRSVSTSIVKTPVKTEINVWSKNQKSILLFIWDSTAAILFKTLSDTPLRFSSTNLARTEFIGCLGSSSLFDSPHRLQFRFWSLVSNEQLVQILCPHDIKIGFSTKCSILFGVQHFSSSM